ncbi:MAG: type II secretion system inner membrane protein GspF [Planctomycetota bacterium]
MAVFAFEAIDTKGKRLRREVEAASKQEALGKIRTMGLRPTKVQERRGAKAAAAGETQQKQAMRLFDRVTSAQLTHFTSQLATLQDAGLPIVRSLKILATQMKPCKFKEQIDKVTEEVESGSSLSEALEKFPRTFDSLFVAMVRAGEAGGVLDVILQRLSDFQEKSLRLKKKVQGAMIYPIVVSVVAIGILAIIMTKVIPQFQKMFKELGQGLPAPTRVLLAISDTVQTYWWLAPVVVVLMIVVIKFLARTDKGGRAFDRFKLTMPVFGSIVRKSTISRFCRTLGTLISSGVPILDALNIVREAVGNKVIAGAIADVHGSIREGETIAEPLVQSGVFDPLLVNMIDIGEETGELDKMLSKIADNYDLEVDVLVDSLTSILEPFLIVGMGIAVAFIVISLFLPLISIIQNI